MFTMFNNYRYTNSTAIRWVAYDTDTSTLRVVFQPRTPKLPGTGYDFANVSRSTYLDLAVARSVGEYFLQNIRGKYSTTRLEASEVAVFIDTLAQREYCNSLLFANAQRV